MEPEHVKGSSSENVTKTPQDGSPPHGGSSGDVSSSSGSSLEFTISEQGTLQRSSANESLSSSPEPSTVSPEQAQLKSPPTQTMGQPPGYDPNRIPASVFSSKSGNPTEWSVASNESLFSIHMGNNSFSRDYAILYGKSGEFPRPEDWNGANSNLMELPRLEEWNSAPPKNELSSLPPVMEVPAHEEISVPSGEDSRTVKKDEPRSTNVAPAGEIMENHVKENPVPAAAASPPVVAPTPAPAPAANMPDVKQSPPAETAVTSSSTPPTFPSPPRLSDESGNSSTSFAFPVLVNDGGKSAASLKVVPEKPEQPESQPQPPKETPPPNATENSMFSCFPCWPKCC
ncbi:hypothetical protein Salat_1393100 [Sesamum alatum]|uniref:Uncharacterized protein n=1 Tax=Sesamum alatum TaxID=300844 RepID=A0AAE2CL73_9LAMI|nr:hypothetical protein Salat_1393100 [Sesamum alatum]